MTVESNASRLLLREAALVTAARGVRAFGDGCSSLLLPVHLARLGYDAFEIGVLAALMLSGSSILTLLVGLFANRSSSRTLLILASMLMLGTGFCLALPQSLLPLLIISFVGTINPSTGDVSPFLPIEQAHLGRIAPPRQRTSLLARYTFVASVCSAAGALAAGLPEILGEAAGIGIDMALRAAFVGYGLLGLVLLLIYRRLSFVLPGVTPVAPEPLRKSRRIVLKLSALFALDAFAGGLVVQSLLALWLFERFQISLASAGTLFFAAGLISAVSQLLAGPLARRIGLLRTMVFTHVFSNAFLMLVPLVPYLSVAIALLFLRAFFSQMDIPARTSYVMAMVTPGELRAAASVTAVPRGLAAALGPALSGALISASPFGWSLLLAGGLKIAYDFLLLATFRKVRPPEELPAADEARPPSQAG